MAAYRRSFLPIAAISLAACLGGGALVPGRASTPTLMWAGAKQVNLLCNVAGGPGIDHLALAGQLCGDVRRLASEGSPLPIVTIALGDPAVLASDAVTLLVHASVSGTGSGRLIAYSVRPHRPSAAGTEILFGAPPRAASLPASSNSSRELDAALLATLSETLPWMRRPAHPQPIEAPTNQR